jgi:hypothetical protein
MQQRLCLAVIVSGLLLLVTAAGLIVVSAEAWPHATAGRLLNVDAGPQPHPADLGLLSA